MRDVVISGNAYDVVIPILLHLGRGFVGSEDYEALKGTADDLPGVVAAGYARYVARARKASDGDDWSVLIQPLNLLSAVGDPRIDEMLRDEVIEQLDADEVLEDAKAWFSDDLMRVLGGYVSFRSR